jgi:hypothetical protein
MSVYYRPSGHESGEDVILASQPLPPASVSELTVLGYSEVTKGDESYDDAWLYANSLLEERRKEAEVKAKATARKPDAPSVPKR